MTIARFDTGARLSHAVTHGDIVYLAGQVSEGDNVTVQTQAVLKQIDDLLARCGSSKKNLLTATIWLPDLADFDAMNVVWEAWLAGVGAPTRATGQVKLPHPGHKVEIIITAVKG
jgi:enamine deaminase RidA (YjgF/YER057c/UK114 family)